MFGLTTLSGMSLIQKFEFTITSNGEMKSSSITVYRKLLTPENFHPTKFAPRVELTHLLDTHFLWVPFFSVYFSLFLMNTKEKEKRMTVP